MEEVESKKVPGQGNAICEPWRLWELATKSCDVRGARKVKLAGREDLPYPCRSPLEKTERKNEQGKGWREGTKETEADIFLLSPPAPPKDPVFYPG